MKILTIADDECPALWDYYVPGRLKDYDLIISCGDLSPRYLSFLVTMARCPVLYVHGNHDSKYDTIPPEGCDCIDDRIVEYNGVRIMGLGGCRQYHPGTYQFTERKMRSRIRKMWLPLKRTRGVDILVTHSPAEGLGDAPDPAHWGFSCFVELLDKLKPAYMLHGHVHMTYNAQQPRVRDYNGTTLINAYERYVLDIPEYPHPENRHNQLIWRSRDRHKED